MVRSSPLSNLLNQPNQDTACVFRLQVTQCCRRRQFNHLTTIAGRQQNQPLTESGLRDTHGLSLTCQLDPYQCPESAHVDHPLRGGQLPA